MTGWLLYKEKNPGSVHRELENLELLCTVGGMQHGTWYSMESGIVIPQKVKRKLSHTLVIISRTGSKEMCLYTHVRRIFQDSQQ